MRPQSVCARLGVPTSLSQTGLKRWRVSPSSAAHVASVVLWIDRRVVLPEGAHDVVVNAPFEMDSSGMGTWFGLLDVQVSPNNRSASAEGTP